MRTVVITGASSGIGAALARRYAGQGVVLGLIARDCERLDALAAECRARGADVHTAMIDVRHRDELAAWLDGFDRVTPIDLLIANAGIITGVPRGEGIEPADIAHAVMETNVLGMLNAVQPVLANMVARGAGQIAIVSSLAAYLSFPEAPSYAASKAALLSYGLGLRAAVAAKGVKVSMVCPGYVATPMGARTHGLFKLFEISAERVARSTERGLRWNLPVIAIPVPLAVLTWIGACLPDPLRRWVSRPFRFTVSDLE